jgi:hypothetical protein
MSNEIKIKISQDTSTAGFKQVKQELRDVETASDKAGNAIAKMERDARGRFVKKIPVEFDVEDLPPILDGKSKTKVKVPVVPDDDAGPSFMQKFMGGAIKASEPVSKALGDKVGLLVGAAAAPVLAATIGTALSAGAGLGVIGAGIGLAVSGDKGIQLAGKNAAKKFMEGMQEEAKVFAGPVRESLVLLGEAGERVTQKWGDAFEDLQGEVVPFVKDVIESGERINEAFVNIASGSGGAALQGLGDSLRLVSDGVGDMLETVADGSPQAADNLVLLAGATADVARQTGNFLDVLNKASTSEWITGPLIPLLRDKYEEAAEATGTFERHTKGMTDELVAATEAALTEKSALEALSIELKAQSDPVFGVIKAQNDLKAAQKETAEATKEHGKKSDQAEAALQKQAAAALALEANIGLLGDTFDGKMTPAMKATLRAAGLEEDAIKALEKQFKAAKKAGDKFADKYRATAVLDGYRDANGKLNGLLRDLQKFDGVWTATMITNYERHGKPGTGGGLASGGIKGAASGMIGDGLTWTGENGPELLDLPPGTRVHSNPDSMRIAAAAADRGAAGPMQVNLVVDGRVLAEVLMDPQREIVRMQYQGSAQNAWGWNN